MTAELKQRLTFSAIGIPLLLGVFWLGGWYLWSFLLVFAFLAQREYVVMLKLQRVKNPVLENIFFALTTLMIFGVMTWGALPEWFPLYILAGMMIGTVVSQFFPRSGKPIFLKNVALNLSIIYTMFFPGLIYLLDKHYHNQHILLLLVVLIWITDSAAYFIGVNFGKHRGIFPVSPNKSLEGFVAGLAAPFVIMLVAYQINQFWTIKQILLVCLCAGLVGQLGDLLESKLKRIAGVKDSSHLIPGHGGVLDRFDSLLLAAPVLYILLRILP